MTLEERNTEPLPAFIRRITNISSVLPTVTTIVTIAHLYTSKEWYDLFFCGVALVLMALSYFLLNKGALLMSWPQSVNLDNLKRSISIAIFGSSLAFGLTQFLLWRK